MIQITPELVINEQEIQFEFVHADGPGGQNVNKVSSAVQLRFNAKSLPTPVFERLARIAGKKLAKDGTLIISAKRYRRQEANRQDALNRLTKLLERAAKVKPVRKKTRPTAAATKKRLMAKRHRSEIKKSRESVKTFNE
jgi:ribosome-associated protein